MVSIHCSNLLGHVTIMRASRFNADFFSQLKLTKLPLIHCFVTNLDGLIDISECFITMFNFSGFDGNQFDNDEEGRGNKVYLQSDTRQIPCQIHPDGTNENQITVITPAFEYVNQISKINSTE